MRKKILFIILTAMVFASCGNYYGDENLGSGYFVWKDGRYASLVYNEDREDAEGGYTVIEENIIETKANEKCIIAKSVKYNNYKQRILSYWIIDKSKQLDMSKCKDQASCDAVLKPNLIKETDSLAFTKILKRQDIDLSFDGW